MGDVAHQAARPEKVPGPDGKEVDKPFPFVKLGDSDKVQPGDWSLALGNPFLLASDFTPTVTFGLVSGTHRYQYPAGTLWSTPTASRPTRRSTPATRAGCSTSTVS